MIFLRLKFRENDWSQQKILGDSILSKFTQVYNESNRISNSCPYLNLSDPLKCKSARDGARIYLIFCHEKIGFLVKKSISHPIFKIGILKTSIFIGKHLYNPSSWKISKFCRLLCIQGFLIAKEQVLELCRVSSFSQNSNSLTFPDFPDQILVFFPNFFTKSILGFVDIIPNNIHHNIIFFLIKTNIVS